MAIVRFELSRHLRSLSTYVYFTVFFAASLLTMAGTGGAFSDSMLDISDGKVLANSPYTLHDLISVFGYFGLLVMAAVSGRAAYQDTESGADSFLFTYPIRKRDYLTGRFLEAVLILILIFSSIALGAWAATFLPGLDQQRLGPNRLMAYVMPYLTSVIPNILITCTMFFSLGVLTRKASAVYLGNVLLVTGYLAASALISDIENRWIASLVDPFGSEAGDRLTQYWTIAEKNTRLVGLTGMLLWNRVLWLSLAAILAGFTYWRFRMTLARPIRGTDDAPAAPVLANAGRVKPGGGRSVAAFFHLTFLQFTETVKNVYFLVIVLAGVLVMVLAGRALGDIYGTPTYPVTYQTTAIASGSFTIFMLILITLYAGELVWRERDARMNELVDVLPLPRWMPFLAKLAALFLIPIVLEVVVMLTGIGIQLSKGYTRIDLPLYMEELLGLQLAGYLLMCVLAFTIQVLVNHKYLGHFGMVLYYLAATFMGNLGFEQHIYNYGSNTSHIYSDMNHFGAFLGPELLFDAYWACAAVILALVAHLFRVEGLASDWRSRWRAARARLKRKEAMLGVTAAAGFAVLGATIYYNTHLLHRFRTKWQSEELSKHFEQTYRKYLHEPQPRILSSSVAVDLYPKERRFRAHGTYQIANKSGKPIERVLVTQSFDEEWKIRDMRFSFPANLEVQDRDAGLRIYRLPEPLPQGATGTFDFDFEYTPVGFSNGGIGTRVVDNGTFLDSDSFPAFGYDEGAELSDDTVRRKHGLAPKPRMHDLDDASWRMQNDTSSDSDWVTLDTVISTDPDQVAIAPGELQREWREGSRRFFAYRTRGKALRFFCVVSARYKVLRDRWNGVDLGIYYQPGHEYNLAKMMQGLKDALDYCTKNFGPYQNATLRIVEFPRYRALAQSFLASIPFSEAIGFIARVNPSDEKDIDYPYYVTAHEVAHQWWGHQVVGADVEGAPTISESLAQYTALMVMKKEFGPARMRRFLKYEMDNYLNGRSGENKRETPLLRSEGQNYVHYNKGSVVFYALQDYVGEENINRALRTYLQKTAYQEPPYTTSRELEAELRAVTPAQYQYLIDDMLDSITLYENKADSASYREIAKGKYEVKLEVSAKKFRADGLGAETEVPLSDWIDIGVLDAKGNPLYMEKHKIEKASSQFTVTVEGLPDKAGIDPWNKLVDRTPGDNTMKVSKM